MIVDWWPSIKRRSLTLLKGLGVVGFLAICVGLLIWGSVEWAPKTETTKSVLVWDSLWGIISVSFVGMCVAVFGILWTRKTAQQRETLKFINDYNDSLEAPKGFAVIHRLRNLRTQQEKQSESIINEEVKNILDRDRKNDGDQQNNDRKHVLFLINKLEILAIGWNEKIYSENMISRCFRCDIINIYIDSVLFIRYIRQKEKDPDAFSGLEALIKKIIKDFPELQDKFEEAQKQLNSSPPDPETK